MWSFLTNACSFTILTLEYSWAIDLYCILFSSFFKVTMTERFFTFAQQFKIKYTNLNMKILLLYSGVIFSPVNSPQGLTTRSRCEHLYVSMKSLFFPTRPLLKYSRDLYFIFSSVNKLINTAKVTWWEIIFNISSMNSFILRII